MSEHVRDLPDVTVLPLRPPPIPAPVLFVAVLAVLGFLGGFSAGLTSDELIVLAVLIALGGGAMLYFVMRMAHPLRLTLTREGFEYRIGRKSWARNWSDVDSIGVEATRGRPRVLITWKMLMPTMAPMNSSPTSKDGFTSFFGMKPTELAVLMNQYRASGKK